MTHPTLLILRGITGAGKTTLGARLAGPRYGFHVMELDDLKAEIHAGKCVPHMDFPEFGRRVRRELDQGKNVVAIEAFIDKDHFNWFLDAVGVSLADPSIFVVWMECDVGTSIERKADVLTEQVVRGQHRRLPGKFHVPGELSLNTAALSKDDIVQRILAHLPQT